MNRTLTILAAAALFVGCEMDRDRDDDRFETRDRTTTSRPLPEPTTSGSVPARAEVSEMDRTFVQEAASGNLFEIQSAQLAVDRNVDPQLKQMASMILQDHQKASEELKSIANSKNIQFPQRMSAPHQRMYDQLREAQGAEFAQQFQRQQDQAHRDAITLFDRQAREGSDPDLKSFAQKTLPVLRKHMDHVQQYRPGEMREHDMTMPR